jgi:anti-anti-sigma factor
MLRPAVQPRDGTTPPPRIRCDVACFDEHATVSVWGDVDVATAPVVLGALDWAVTMPITEIAVDLEHVTFLGISGLSTLVAGQRRAADREIAFSVVAAPREVRRAIEVSGLAELLRLAP